MQSFPKFKTALKKNVSLILKLTTLNIIKVKTWMLTTSQAQATLTHNVSARARVEGR